MKHLVLALAVLATPAVAQDAVIYAPCLEQFPAPDEFGAADDYIAAMEDAGWNHRTWGMMIDRVAPPLAEIAAARILFPSRFRNAQDVSMFMDQAATRYEQTLPLVEIFTRDGVSASVSVAELDPGQMSVSCTFAGIEVPGAEAIFAEDTAINEEFAFMMGNATVDLPEGTTDLHVSALRFTGPDAILAPLSAREGVSASYTYEAPE